MTSAARPVTLSSKPAGCPVLFPWGVAALRRPGTDFSRGRLDETAALGSRKTRRDLVFPRTRLPVAALFEHLDQGSMIEEFLEWFPVCQRPESA